MIKVAPPGTDATRRVGGLILAGAILWPVSFSIALRSIVAKSSAHVGRYARRFGPQMRPSGHYPRCSPVSHSLQGRYGQVWSIRLSSYLILVR